MIKKTQGRKKIEMKKIGDRNSLQVTFSKRRAGLFKKASELCVLTGAETAIVVQSPGERIFAFGHPSVDSVVDQYLAGSSSMPHEADASINEVIVNSTGINDKFNQEYLEITKEMEDEKGKKINLVENQVEEDDLFWWQHPFDDLGLEELEKYISSMETLKNNLMGRANEMNMIQNSLIFNVNLSSKNEELDTLVVENNAGYEYGDEHILPSLHSSI